MSVNGKSKYHCLYTVLFSLSLEHIREKLKVNELHFIKKRMSDNSMEELKLLWVKTEISNTEWLSDYQKKEDWKDW